MQINVQFTEKDEPVNNNAVAGKIPPLKDVANKIGQGQGQQDDDYESISEGESGSNEEPYPAELETGKARGQFVPEHLRTELKSAENRGATSGNNRPIVTQNPLYM